MDLLENPFYIIGAHPCDNRQRIMELAEERSLLHDSNKCTEACSELTNPRKRLAAEIAWMPGATQKEVENILSLLELFPENVFIFEELSSIARANLLVAGLVRLYGLNAQDAAKWIFKISLAFEEHDAEHLCIVINKDRDISGFPKVSDISAIESEIHTRRIYYCQVIASILKNLSPKEHQKALTIAAEKTTDNGAELCPIILDHLVDSYEIETKDILDKEEVNIKTTVRKLQSALDAKHPDLTIHTLVNQLIQIIRNWDAVARPILVCAKSKGLNHDASNRIADSLLNLSIRMFRDHNKPNFSQQLIDVLQEAFAETGEIAERIADEANKQRIANEKIAADALKLTQKHTEEKRYLLNFLKYLDNSFEVFFNQHINGDKPDIVIMRKDHGIMIITVKDYVLSNYKLDESKNWIDIRNNNPVKCPVEQLNTYKENLFNLHIGSLFEKKRENTKYFGMVACAVYFHNASQNEIENFYGADYYEKTRYTTLIGKDQLNEQYFNDLLEKRYLLANTKSCFFTDDLYEEFKYFLSSPIHQKEEGKHIAYTNEQRKLIYELTKKQAQIKIKGVAGSGKTTTLAGMAVYAYKRTRGKVLILTYNIALLNYIREKINQVDEVFPWNAFTILNYHEFIKIQLNNLEIPIMPPPQKCSIQEENKYFEKNYYSNEELFDAIKPNIERYNTILIDEVQDYKRAWLDIIKNYFLEDNGEYFLFFDAKQNIYGNCEMQSRDIVTNVTGRPVELEISHRSNTKIQVLISEFQKVIFKNKYEPDTSLAHLLQEIVGIEGSVNYKYFPDEENYEELLYGIIQKYRNDNKIPINDITVLGTSIEKLQDFDSYYRNKSKEKTTTTFEEKEADDKWNYKNIRRKKRKHFHINSGLIKISTIHSFKGMECEWVFLVINQSLSNDELLYTGITRARSNIVIINFGNEYYDHKLKNIIEKI